MACKHIRGKGQCYKCGGKLPKYPGGGKINYEKENIDLRLPKKESSPFEKYMWLQNQRREGNLMGGAGFNTPKGGAGFYGITPMSNEVRNKYWKGNAGIEGTFPINDQLRFKLGLENEISNTFNPSFKAGLRYNFQQGGWLDSFDEGGHVHPHEKEETVNPIPTPVDNPIFIKGVKNSIGDTESGWAADVLGVSQYEVTNKALQENFGKPDSSSATGKFQILKSQAKRIKKFGNLPKKLTRKEVMAEFQNNPQLQEDYMDNLIKTEYLPQTKALSNIANKYGKEATIAAIHLNGYPQAKKLNKLIGKGKEDGFKVKGGENLTVQEYMGRFQTSLDKRAGEAITNSASQGLIPEVKNGILSFVPPVQGGVLPGENLSAFKVYAEAPKKANGGWLDTFHDGGEVGHTHEEKPSWLVDLDTSTQSLESEKGEKIEVPTEILASSPEELELATARAENRPGTPIKQRTDFEGNFLSEAANAAASGEGWLHVPAKEFTNTGGIKRNEAYGDEVYDLYRNYFGLPLKTDAVKISNYRPTNETDPSSVYYTNQNPKFKSNIIDIYNNLTVKEKEKIKKGSIPASGYYTDSPLYSLMMSNEARASLDKNRGASTAIGNFKLGEGEDEQGKYISYYDVFDKATGSVFKGSNENLLGTAKPYELYDRIYLNDFADYPIGAGTSTYKNGGWLDTYHDGGEVGHVHEGDKVMYNTPAYRKAFDNGQIATQGNGMLYAPDLPVFEVNATAQETNKDGSVKYPFYDRLTKEEQSYIDDTSPIGSAMRAKAEQGYGYDGRPSLQQSNLDFAKDFALMPASLGLSALGMPQAAMIEGIEGLKGNKTNWSNILPTPAFRDNKQRLPSDTFLKDVGSAYDVPTPWGDWNVNPIQFAGDMILDPVNLVGAGMVLKAGLSAKLPIQTILKNISKELGSEAVLGIDQLAKAGVKGVKKLKKVASTTYPLKIAENAIKKSDKAIAAGVDIAKQSIKEVKQKLKPKKNLKNVYKKDTQKSGWYSETQPDGTTKQVRYNKDGSKREPWETVTDEKKFFEENEIEIDDGTEDFDGFENDKDFFENETLMLKNKLDENLQKPPNEIEIDDDGIEWELMQSEDKVDAWEDIGSYTNSDDPIVQYMANLTEKEANKLFKDLPGGHFYRNLLGQKTYNKHQRNMMIDYRGDSKPFTGRDFMSTTENYEDHISRLISYGNRKGFDNKGLVKMDKRALTKIDEQLSKAGLPFGSHNPEDIKKILPNLDKDTKKLLRESWTNARKEQQTLEANFETAIKKHKNKGEAFSAVRHTNEDITGQIVDGIYEPGSFISASRGKGKADFGKNRIMFDVPEGQSYMKTESIMNEREIVLPKHLQYRVKNTYANNELGGTDYIMEIVNKYQDGGWLDTY